MINIINSTDMCLHTPQVYNTIINSIEYPGILNKIKQCSLLGLSVITMHSSHG